MHHLDRAAGQPEGERPQGTLPAPIHQVVHPAHQLPRNRISFIPKLYGSLIIAEFRIRIRIDLARRDPDLH